MSNLSNKDTGMFCNICNFLTMTSIDHESKMKAGVCRGCNLKFVQPNRKKWDNGWRPTEEEVREFKISIEKSVHSILSDINNYI